MADERLTPARRVKSRKDYLRLQKEGRKFRSSHFLIAIGPRAEGETDSRIGVTITTKIDKRAARRNRLRRRVRDVFRKLHHRLVGVNDIVVIALTGSVDLEYDEVRRQLNSTLKKARLLPGGHDGGRMRPKNG